MIDVSGDDTRDGTTTSALPETTTADASITNAVDVANMCARWNIVRVRARCYTFARSHTRQQLSLPLSLRSVHTGWHLRPPSIKHPPDPSSLAKSTSAAHFETLLYIYQQHFNCVNSFFYSSLSQIEFSVVSVHRNRTEHQNDVTGMVLFDFFQW